MGLTDCPSRLATSRSLPSSPNRRRSTTLNASLCSFSSGIHLPSHSFSGRAWPVQTKPQSNNNPQREQAPAADDSGVIWNRIAFEAPVIPGKAGIQSVGGAFPMACGVDSRFRGNDCPWGRAFLANDTTTRRMVVQFGRSVAAVSSPPTWIPKLSGDGVRSTDSDGIHRTPAIGDIAATINRPTTGRRYLLPQSGSPC